MTVISNPDVEFDSGAAAEVDSDLVARQSLAARLARARTSEQVAAIAVEHGLNTFGASLARVAILDDRGVFTFVGDALHEEYGSFSLHGGDPAVEAFQSQRPRFWTQFDDFALAHPRAARALRPLAVRSIALLPMFADGDPAGVWFLGFPTTQRFSATERVALAHAALEVAIALERSRLYEFERSVATELQRSLLPPPVLIEGAGHCSRYIAAVSSLTIGGDWYDTMRLANGRIGLAVGDAVGRGLRAATVMGQLRSALGACALRAADAADTIDCLDEFASNIADATSSSVAYAIVDPVGGSVEYCCAGHPPPLCAAPDGRTWFLDQAQMRPLGFRSGDHRRLARSDFPAGSVILLYSDGLVERRGRSLDDGLEALASAVAQRVTLPIDHLADAVLDELLATSDRTDDVTLLVLRSPVSTPNMLLRKTHATPEALAPLRCDVRAWMRAAEIPEPAATSLLVAVGEACMNAVQHAYTSEMHPMLRVEASRVGDEVVVNVTDTGTWKAQSPRSRGGRGIDIMRKLATDVTVQRRVSGTTVTFREHIGAAP